MTIKKRKCCQHARRYHSTSLKSLWFSTVCITVIQTSQSEKSSEDEIHASDVQQLDKTTWRKPDNPIIASTSMYTCGQHRTIPGHTGFLTFASLFSRPG